MRVQRRLVWSICLVALVGATSAASVLAGEPLSLAVTGADGRPAGGVVVYLPDVRTPAVAPPVVIDQRGEEFVPAVAVVTAGSDVRFTNSDPTSHHIYSFSTPNAFALPLYKGDAPLTRHFAKPGVVVLGCNIHDSMLGYIAVVDSTRAGVTGPDGRVTLANVPAGSHVVRVWAPGLDRGSPPEAGTVVVSDGAPAHFSLQVDVAGRRPGPKKGSALAGRDY